MIVALLSIYFKIRVLDEATGRGVPLVELRTVDKRVYMTDSAGLVAFAEPGLMGREVYFHVRSHGYEAPKDGFGYRGAALKPTPGGSATIRIKRLNVAERVARLTGVGIYRDSVLLGEKAPLKEPLLNGGVVGQDTAQAEVYKGRMMWFWGDTDRTGYPLGNFHTSGAVATRAPGGGLDYRYFEKDGFVREMVPSKEPGPVWTSGLVVLGSAMYGYYARMRSLGEIAESGLLRWNDAAERFDVAQTFDKARGWRFLDGHTLRDGGFVLGSLPPNVRVPADAPSLLDPARYEAFTCLGSDGLVRRKEGKPDYRWQKEGEPITPKVEQRLVAGGALKAEEAHFLPRDAAGEVCVPHGGSVHWNAHRRRWIMVFTRLGGKGSHLGEIHYSEADAPTGPFLRSVKILEHDRYTFYNPVHHAFLDEGETIYFEGTYTAEFSGNPEKTPLYDYNQILYRLDLDDPRLGFVR